MKTVILIKGLKRSGKDTTADIMVRKLQGKHIVSKLSFAEPMKEIIADTFNVSIGTIETVKNEDSTHPILCEARPLGGGHYIRFHTDMRLILQRFGTEAMKKQFGDDVWVELTYKKIISDIIVISDWRFKSELEYLKKQSDVKVITVQVVRAGQISTDTHISERDLDDVKCDFVLYNITGELENLECQIDALLYYSLLSKKYPDLFKCSLEHNRGEIC